MAETPEVRINVRLEQATQQIDQFAQALSRVDQKARGIFASLQNLSRQYEQQGFLGAGDQRTLERGLQQWERARHLIELRRAGAAARVAEVQAGDPLEPGYALREANALRAWQQLNLHRQGLATLQGRVGNLFAGDIPGVTNAWIAGPSALRRAHAAISPTGPITPLQWAHADLQLRQRLQTEWGMEQAQLLSIFAQMGAPASLALPFDLIDAGRRRRDPSAIMLGRRGGWAQAAAAGLPIPEVPGPPPTARLPWDLIDAGRDIRTPGALGLGRRAGWAQAAAAGLPPPPPPNWLERAGAWGGEAMPGFLAWGGRMAGRVGGLAAGYGAYQLLSEGMKDYETRWTGVLRVGSMLGGQYQDLDATITRLRRDYKLLAQEAVEAMTTIGRATGGVAGIDRTMAVGRAYGIEPGQAAALHASFALLGANAVPDLGRITGARNWAVGRGIDMLPGAPFLSEVEKIAQVGGLGFAPLGEGQYGALGVLMSSFGGRYRGAPGAAYEQFAAGVGEAGNQYSDALRQQAAARVAQRTPVVMLGKRALNIRDSWWDRQTALENAAQIPEMLGGLFEQVQLQGGGNPDLAKSYYQLMFRTPKRYQAGVEYEGLRNIATTEPGGIEAWLRRAGAQEDTTIAQLLAGQQTGAQKGVDIRERAAAIQALGETGVIADLEKYRTNLQKTIGVMAEAAGPIDAVTKGFQELDPAIRRSIGAFLIIGGLISQNPALIGGGAAVGAGPEVTDWLGDLLTPSVPFRPEAQQRRPNPWISPRQPEPGATSPRTTK